MDTERNILFGVLALQADLLTPAQFAQACSAWTAAKDTPLADLLVERGWLTAGDRADVDKLLQRKLDKHKGDVRVSLAAVTTDAVRNSLAGLNDPDVRQSLSGPTPPPHAHVLIATTEHAPEARERYTLSRLHATGGIGRVWLARDANLGRDVALKELRPERAGNPALWGRFLKEAQVTGQLEHPGIIPVYEIGRRPDDQAPFYTMRFVRGRTLAEAAKAYHKRRARGEAGPLELRGLLNNFVGICHAIAYAHSRGVLHRDLKPQNVVLGDYGEVIVLDWGLAKVTGAADEPAGIDTPASIAPTEAAEATVAGQVLGTPAYMAPEQAEGRLDLLDARTDVYGLGAVLYEILTGSPPFAGSDTATVLRKVTHEPPERPRSLAAGTPAALEAVCLKALAKKSSVRYATATDLATDIQRWLADEPVSAHREALTVRLGRIARRHRTLVTAAAVGLLVTAVSLGVAATLLTAANDRLGIALREEREAKDREAAARKDADENAAKEREAKDREAAARNDADVNAAKERNARIAEQKALAFATSQMDLSYDALGDLVLKIQIDLDETPGGRNVRKMLLEDTMRKLNRLVQTPATNDRFFRRYASAHMQLGEILWGLNRRGDAEQEYKKAGEYSERAFAANPTSDKAKANIAANNNRMGDTELFYHKRLEPARKLYEAGLPIWKGLADKMVAFPDGDPALPELERITLVDAEDAVADTYDRMGIVALRFDFDYAKAEDWFTKSLEIRKRHVEKIPSHQHRVALGASYIYLAELALQHNDLDKALKLHEELLKQREASFAERRWSLKARRDLADARGKFGDDLMLAKRNEEGHKMYVAARDLFQQVRAAEPDDPVYRGLVAHAHYRCGTSFLRIGDPKAARHEFEEGLKLRQAVYAEVTDQQQKFIMQPQLMLALVRNGKHAEAADMAASVRKNIGVMPIHLAEAGACYGLCMAAVGDGKPVAELAPEEKQLRQRYLDLALACFEEASQKKYDDLLFLESDADFDVLRGVPEYERWLDSFRQSLKGKK